MGRPLRVLFVEDLEDDALLLARRLSQAGFDPFYERVEDYEGMREALERGEWDIVISDYVMPHFSGPAALRLLQETGADIPFIIISGTVGEDLAVETLKAGADDYLMKDRLARFVAAVERSLREAESRRERRRSEDALRESEQRYRELAEAIGDVFFAMDGELRYTYWNRTSEELTGIPAADALGKSLFEIFPETRGTAVEKNYREALETKSPRSFGYEIALGGERRWFEIATYPTASGLVVFARDESVRRRSQQRLARLNQCLLNLGADPEENIARIVSEGLEILEGDLFKYWRSGVEEYSLHSASSSLRHYEKKPARMEREAMELAFMWHNGPIASGGEEGPDIAAMDPDVEAFGLRALIGHPVLLREETIGCLCLFDRREREFTREEINLMGMLARALSIEEERWAEEISLRDFIEITSHELRHPITIMKGYAVTLKDMGGRLDTAQAAEVIESIDRGADRLTDLLEKLLDLARVERGRLAVSKQAVAFESILDAAIRDAEARHKGRNFIKRLSGEVGEVRVDAGKIGQVFSILLDNASRFSPPEADVEIEATMTDDEIQVSILDRGPGVPEGHRDRIFKRFYQVEDVLHHSVPGVGIGLYISWKILEAHGGRIWHKPREGGGSCFRFTLPR